MVKSGAENEPKKEPEKKASEKNDTTQKNEKAIGDRHLRDQ